MLLRRLMIALVSVLITFLPGTMSVAAGTRTSFTVDVASITPAMPELWTIEEVTTPGDNTHMLHLVEVYTFTSDDPRVGGLITFDYRHFVQKQEHPAPFWGPGLGEWWIEVNGQRTWEGTFHILPQTEPYTIKYVAHGVGIYEGLQLTMLNTWLPTAWSITGEILDPKSQ